MKLEILSAIGQPPEVYWLGSSTSREIDPRSISAATGKRSFNAALSAGGPAEHFAMVQALRSRFPQASPHLVIALDVESLRKRKFVPFSPRPAGAQPSATTRYRWDGFRRVDPYRNRILAKELPISIARYQVEIYPFYPKIDDAQLRYLSATIAAANSWGDVPTVVIMPAHPSFSRALSPRGRSARAAQLLAALTDIGASGLKLNVVHLASPTSFGGSSTCYSDGVHLRPCNARRLVSHIDSLGLLGPVATG
jgi:hypothetical protein